MDWISFTVSSAAQLILAQQRGEEIGLSLEKHNRDFARSYERWFNGLYRDKYEYLGEYDLLRLAFLLDLGLYYFGVASQPFKHGKKALCKPVFAAPVSTPFFHLMRAYNGSFARIARTRRRRHRLGRSHEVIVWTPLWIGHERGTRQVRRDLLEHRQPLSCDAFLVQQ